jgi:hypothetical protein
MQPQMGAVFGKPDDDEAMLRGYARGLYSEPQRPGLGHHLGEWAKTTWPAQIARALMSAATLPGDVVAGRVHPAEMQPSMMSGDTFQRQMDLAGALQFGGMPMASRNPNVLRSGMGGADDAARAARGLGELPRDNYRRPLSDYTSRVYREVSPEDIGYYVPGSPAGGLREPELYVANRPELALGQGSNRGARFELDANYFDGRVNTQKPTWEHSWGRGDAEFVATPQYGVDMRDAFRSVDIAPGTFDNARGLSLGAQRLLENMVADGRMQRMELPDGTIRYVKPE